MSYNIFGEELGQELVEKSKMNSVTKVNDKLPIEEPKLVVLTIEEAKEILQSSYDLLSWADCPCIHADKALEIQSYLKERIQQTEKENASN